MLALPGNSRGDLLGAWGRNVTRRFGAASLSAVRARLPASLRELPAELTARDWVPVYAQLLVTEAIVDELLGGDMRALYPLLVEDTRAGMTSVQLMLVRTLGPARAMKLSPRAFRTVHERGSVEIDVDARAHCGRLTFAGTPLFTHPTWRLLQLFATLTMLELAGKPGFATGEDNGPDGFIAVSRW